MQYLEPYPYLCLFSLPQKTALIRFFIVRHAALLLARVLRCVFVCVCIIRGGYVVVKPGSIAVVTMIGTRRFGWVCCHDVGYKCFHFVPRAPSRHHPCGNNFINPPGGNMLNTQPYNRIAALMLLILCIALQGLWSNSGDSVCMSLSLYVFMHIYTYIYIYI